MSAPGPDDGGTGAATDIGQRGPVTRPQRWLARLSVLAALAAIAVIVVGGTKSLGVVISAVGGLAVTLAAAWLFLSNRGIVRWLAAALVVAAPVSVTVLYISRDLLWAVLLALVLTAISTAAGRAAILRARPFRGVSERKTDPPRRPFVIMHPRSGGGKVGKFHLDTKAAAHGATVALIEGPGEVDVAALARQAVTDGADLLGVAGGDGTQALVAGIASEHGLPFLVISAGTRNHFALDLGLDRERPDAGLDALNDGVELCLDLGLIGGRTFVNNASFGVYAEVVQSPAYRDDKRATTLQMLPELLSGERGPRLVVRIDDRVTIDSPKALLVSNNPYELGDLAGLGSRARLDTGLLGVIAVTVDTAAQAAELLRGRRASGIQRYVAHEVVVEADAKEIPVGIDGEAVMMTPPIRCSILPRALRVRVPRDRPGVRAPAPQLDRALLLHQALSTHLLGSRGGRAQEAAAHGGRVPSK
jgi:diacylglycerol kinase family enzyme